MSGRAEKVRRRRRRALLVPLVGVGVAAWAVRRGLADRPDLGQGWQSLPPAPAPQPVSAQPGSTVPGTPEPTPTAAPVATDEAAPPVAEPVVEQVLFEPPAAEPVAARARAVPAAAAVASVTAPALPDAPYGPGSLRALADGSSPHPDYTIKGKTATKVFHAPGGAYYTRTRADVWFRTARDARGAGFTERARRNP